jgi:ABC-type multidrug transport system ATPase subunit
VIVIDEGRVLRESALGSLLADVRHTVVEAALGHTPETLPEGVTLRSAHDGKQTYTADSAESVAALERQLAAAGVAVLARREEQGSLEDFFVRSIGHKVS